ncbi:hypothetical protein ACFW1M_22115, partial [Streptomyces inhibens]
LPRAAGRAPPPCCEPGDSGALRANHDPEGERGDREQRDDPAPEGGRGGRDGVVQGAGDDEVAGPDDGRRQGERGSPPTIRPIE